MGERQRPAGDDRGANPVGINVGTHADWGTDPIFANRIRQSRAWQNISGGAGIDAAGNPRGDAETYIFTGQSQNNHGKYSFAFTGRGTARIVIGAATGLTQSYDAGTNTTTGSFTLTNSGAVGDTLFRVQDTDRDGNFGADNLPDRDGVTNLRLMMPTAPGSTTSYDPLTTFTDAEKNLLRNFTVFRAMAVTGTLEAAADGDWTRRRPPTYLSQYANSAPNGQNGIAWEYLIRLANETGKDLYINVPYNADANYVTKLARLIRFGSDGGVEPYAAAVANPVYAPLDANLKVYVEFSNEVWNGAFPYAGLRNPTDAVNEPASSPIKYDGATSQSLLAKRRVAEKARWVSDLFRGVWGDANMPGTGFEPRVRPVFMFQYADLNGTASTGLGFLDDYYNKRDPDSTFTGTPRPPSYYLYAAGGGWYTDTTNGSGNTGLVRNAGFEAGTADWTFSPANASVVAAGTPPDDMAAIRSLNGADGSISQTLTVPAGTAYNRFAVTVTSRQETSTDQQRLRLFLNGVDQGVFTPGGVNAFDTHYSPMFTAAAGSALTIRVEGAAAAGDHTALVSSVALRSVDAIYTGTLERATSGSDVPAQVGTQSYWVDRYGLKTVGYEGGFSLGGDNSEPFHWYALMDPRARAFQANAIRNYYTAGGDLPIGLVSSGGGYAFSEPFNVHNLDSPKLNGVRDVMNAPPPRTGLFTETGVSPADGTAGVGRVATFSSGAYRGSFTTVNADSTGDYVTYAFNVPQAGTYNIKVRGWQSTDGGQFQTATATALAGPFTNLGGVQDQYATALTGETYDLGTRSFAAGTHYVRFQVTGRNAASAGFKLRLDDILATPQFRINLKTETTATTAAVSGPAVVSEAQAFSSGGTHARFNATADGQFVVYAITVNAPGTYRLNVAHLLNADGGRYRASVSSAVNGTYTNVGAVQDLYNAGGQTRRLADLGLYTFSSAGTYYVKFTVAGKAAASSARTLRFDFFQLDPEFS